MTASNCGKDKEIEKKGWKDGKGRKGKGKGKGKEGKRKGEREGSEKIRNGRKVMGKETKETQREVMIKRREEKKVKERRMKGTKMQWKNSDTIKR